MDFIAEFACYEKALEMPESPEDGLLGFTFLERGACRLMEDLDFSLCEQRISVGVECISQPSRRQRHACRGK